MKKILTLILPIICILTLVSCREIKETITYDYPSIKGTVKEVYENSFLLETENNNKYVISSNTSYEESYNNIQKRDIVTVYYDGNIAETYPMQINTVYVIIKEGTKWVPVII